MDLENDQNGIPSDWWELTSQGWARVTVMVIARTDLGEVWRLIVRLPHKDYEGITRNKHLDLDRTLENLFSQINGR